MSPYNKSTHKPKNIQYLRHSNRAAIIRQFATKGVASRSELVSELQLTKMAISTIVSELLNENLLQECGAIDDSGAQSSGPNAGRKPMALIIPDYRINAIGIFVFRYQMSGIAIDIKGNCFYSTSMDIPPETDNDRFIELITALIQDIISANKKTTFAGIGIASIGPLDIYSQTILNPPNFRNIKDVCVGNIVRERFDLPVFLDNDMNAGALGNYLYGIAKEMKNTVYLGLGSGVGAGVIVDGHMLHGSGGYAGEVGHMSIQMDGPQCSCGRRGCLELYTNTISLLQNAGVHTMEELVQIVTSAQVSEKVKRCMDDYYRAVLSGLITIANTFDPEIIIIGDQGVRLAPLFLTELEKEMNEQIFQRESHNIRLAVSSFGERAPLVGAGAMVFERIFNGELPL
ncbi:MAG: ROK family protein [Acetanaerobacterium sp.]